METYINNPACVFAHPPSSLPYSHTEVNELLNLHVMFPRTREIGAGAEYHTIIRTQRSCFMNPSGRFGNGDRGFREYAMTKDECTEINGDDGRSVGSAKFGRPTSTTFHVVAEPLP